MKNETVHHDKVFPTEHLRDGLTKREYFAATALQGLLASNDQTLSQIANNEGVLVTKVATEIAVQFADALVEALNK